MTMAEEQFNNTSIGVQEVKYVPTHLGEFKPETVHKKRDTLFLCFTIFTGTLLAMAGGSAFTWTSPVIPKIQSNDTNINPLIEPASTSDISMLTGIPVLSGLIGSLVSSSLSDFLGRKKSLYLSGLIMFLATFTVAFSKKIIFIIAARSIFFILLAVVMSILPVYISEVCEIHNRGKYSSILGLMLPCGNLFSYLFGPEFTVRIFTLITAAPTIVFLIGFFFTCETPVYLLSKGKNEECLKSLGKFRSNKSSKEIQLDYKEIEETLKSRQMTKQFNITKLFKSKQGRVGLFLALFPTLIQLGSGIPVILTFLGPIFNQAGTSISGNSIAIIIGAAKVICIAINVNIIERINRRVLLISSTLGCSISLFIVGLFFHFKYINSPIIGSIQWLPLTGMLMYIISYAIGLGTIPILLMGEMFAPDLRPVGVSLITGILGLIIFLLNTTFPFMSKYAGIHWCFWFFSSNLFIGAILTYICLPETKGKSILEIQEKLKNYKFNLKKPV